MKSCFGHDRLRTLIFSVFILLNPALSYAQDSILFILSNDTSIYNELYLKINNKINHTYDTKVIYADNIAKESFSKHKLIIIAGTKSASVISNYKFNAAALYTLIPRKFYHSSITKKSCPGTRCYGVVIEQPIGKYIQLINALFDKDQTIVIPVTKSNKDNARIINSTAKSLGYKLRKLTITPDDNIPRLLSHELTENNILLALPNPDIYNKSTARSIILSAYHNNVPIIAYSQAFAKAGALASLYSSIDNIATQTTLLAQLILNNKNPEQKGYYPETFSIEINKAVARSLNINIMPPDILKRRIK